MQISYIMMNHLIHSKNIEDHSFRFSSLIELLRIIIAPNYQFMNRIMSQSRQMITLAPLQQHKSTLIFLHGLGDSGHGWSELGRSLQPAFVNTKFIFPHADSHPVTINGGYSMPSWYDIRGPLQSYHHNAGGDSSNDDESSLKAENAREDLNGLERSRQRILNLIQQER